MLFEVTCIPPNKNDAMLLVYLHNMELCIASLEKARHLSPESSLKTSYYRVFLFIPMILQYLDANYCSFHLKMEPLSYKKINFEEFCAASISVYQLEALESWEKIATLAFEHFESEGNRVVSIEELAQVRNYTNLFFAKRYTPKFQQM